MKQSQASVNHLAQEDVLYLQVATVCRDIVDDWADVEPSHLKVCIFVIYYSLLYHRIDAPARIRA